MSDLEIWNRAYDSVLMGEGDPKPVLDEGLRLLHDHKVWLSAGTLLGFYRDGGFIPHDTDIDVGMLVDWDDPPTDVDIIHTMGPGGFRPIRIMHRQSRVMQVAFVKDRIVFDIYLFYKGHRDEIALNLNDAGEMNKPLRFVHPPKLCLFGDTDYPTPYPIEEYLEYRYRDWRTPTGKKVAWYQDAAPGLLG